MRETKEFQLSDMQVEGLMSISRAAPALALNCGEPLDRQALANAFWARVGGELGFDYMTARPSSKGPRFFTAEVADTYQCDACDKIVPADEVKSGMPSAGVEGTFCHECRHGKRCDCNAE